MVVKTCFYRKRSIGKHLGTETKKTDDILFETTQSFLIERLTTLSGINNDITTLRGTTAGKSLLNTDLMKSTKDTTRNIASQLE